MLLGTTVPYLIHLPLPPTMITFVKKGTAVTQSFSQFTSPPFDVISPFSSSKDRLSPGVVSSFSSASGREKSSSKSVVFVIIRHCFSSLDGVFYVFSLASCLSSLSLMRPHCIVNAPYSCFTVSCRGFQLICSIFYPFYYLFYYVFYAFIYGITHLEVVFSYL
ncbi:unnamed protein product [Arabis nemorensis]|uniref:Uncharacterized protein n=1 Tax=Arabis nemorensis TaxID=586526 RepID=A0A565CMB1_9BRAS|nr:unnamed protein product [Arabis nemorensis]